MNSFEQFLRVHLPEPPAKLLEVGCGRGELTTALAVAGYDVLGIDPAAPDGDRFRRLKLEEVPDGEGPYDAVVAASSLHHLRDLDVALEKIVRLLGPNGLLVLEEFAWDRIDDSTLAWLFEQQREPAAAGAGEGPGSLETLRAEWEAERVGIHGYDAMRAAVDERFREQTFEWTPYLYRLPGGTATAALEQGLVDLGAIQPLGFRYAGIAA